MSCESPNSPNCIQVCLGSPNVRRPVKLSEIKVRDSTWSVDERMKDTTTDLKQLHPIGPFLQLIRALAEPCCRHVLVRIVQVPRQLQQQRGTLILSTSCHNYQLSRACFVRGLGGFEEAPRA